MGYAVYMYTMHTLYMSYTYNYSINTYLTNTSRVTRYIKFLSIMHERRHNAICTGCSSIMPMRFSV